MTTPWRLFVQRGAYPVEASTRILSIAGAPLLAIDALLLNAADYPVRDLRHLGRTSLV